MSVLASLRGSSELTFLENARLLAKFSMTETKKLPQRYWGVLPGEIADLGRQIYYLVLTANEVNPKTKTEAKRRKTYLESAVVNCRKLAGLLDITWEIVVHEENDEAKYLPDWKQFAEYIETEIKCVKGLIASDERNNGNLKDE